MKFLAAATLLVSAAMACAHPGSGAPAGGYGQPGKNGPTSTGKGGVVGPTKTGSSPAGPTYSYPAGACQQPGKTCIGDSDVKALLTGFGTLISAYTDANADKYLASDFTEYSQSIIYLADAATNGTTDINGLAFASKDAFKKSQASQNPAAFTLIDYLASCDRAAYRWKMNLGCGSPDIEGNSVATLEYVSGAWKIKTQWVEFNSDLFSFVVANIGGYCSGNPPAKIY